MPNTNLKTKTKTNPNPNTNANPNTNLTQILTLFSCFMLFFEHRPLIFSLASFSTPLVLMVMFRIDGNHLGSRMLSSSEHTLKTGC